MFTHYSWVVVNIFPSAAARRSSHPSNATWNVLRVLCWWLASLFTSSYSKYFSSTTLNTFSSSLIILSKQPKLNVILMSSTLGEIFLNFYNSCACDDIGMGIKYFQFFIWGGLVFYLNICKNIHTSNDFLEPVMLFFISMNFLTQYCRNIYMQLCTHASTAKE